ncbi:MAG: polysaccharide deacetylase family protein [Thermoleophilia bacterium]
MTKRQALRVLGVLAGGIGFIFAGAAHLLWYRGRRRAGIWMLLTGAAAELLLLSTTLIPSFPLFGRSFHRGRRNGNSVALTFDDGPRSPHTDRILDALKAESVPATFFVLGDNAMKHPQLVRRMELEGHRVANHGMDHRILMWAGAREAVDQITRGDEALRSAGVIDPAPLFRAPHGWLSPTAHGAISSRGYRVIGWTKGVWDTANPGVDTIVSRTNEVLQPGSILLLHDGWQGDEAEADRSQTAAALPAIIRQAQSRGLRFVTVEQLMQETERRR